VEGNRLRRVRRKLWDEKEQPGTNSKGEKKKKKLRAERPAVRIIEGDEVREAPGS